MAYFTLVSQDGFEFTIPEEAAMLSALLAPMITNEFQEHKSRRAELENIDGHILERVCEYLCYSLKYKDQGDVPDFDVPAELALELLVAADYLDV